jgi:predicted Zn-dependent protease
LNVPNVPVLLSSRSTESSDAVEKYLPLNTVVLMVEAAVLAIGNDSPTDAKNIIDGLMLHASEHDIVPSLVASLATAEGRYADALQVFERLVKSKPQSDALICICASLRKELGVPGWRGLAQRVIDRGIDADAVGSAEKLLAGPIAKVDKMTAPAAKAAFAGLRFAPDRL